MPVDPKDAGALLATGLCAREAAATEERGLLDGASLSRLPADEFNGAVLIPGGWKLQLEGTVTAADAAAGVGLSSPSMSKRLLPDADDGVCGDLISDFRELALCVAVQHADLLCILCCCLTWVQP